MPTRFPMLHPAQAAFNGGVRRILRFAGTLPLASAIAALAFVPAGHSAMAATLTVSTATLATGYAGSAYSAKLAATGGSGSGYTWSISTGTLPVGLTLTSTTGAIAGKPTTAGTVSFTVKVTDSAKNTATATLSIKVDAALKVTTTNLANGYVGSTYSATLAASGGTGTGYAWSITTGTLPAGITLTAATGAIAGKPTMAGTSSITVKVTDSAAHTATANLSILVDPALKVTTATLPHGYVGSAYTTTLVALGGTGTGKVWSISTGTLPAGLTLTAATGAISGKPTTAATSNFTVKVTDSLGHTATANLSILVHKELAVTTTKLITGYVNVAYTATLFASGGTGESYKWTVAAGTLPTGLSLVSTTGVISGKPTEKVSSALTVKVTDSLSHTATASLTLTVNADLSISTSKLAVGYTTSKYSTKLVAAGGSGVAEKWSLVSGTLPAGIGLSLVGVLSGTPTVSGAKTFEIEVKDSAGNTATASLTLTIDPGLTITSASLLPVGYIDTSYSDTLTASGGSGTGLKWTATGALPQGLTLSAAGVLSGSPAAVETSTIDVKVTDSASNTATATMTLRVNPAVTGCTNDHQSTALVELMGAYTFQFNRIDLVTNQRSWSIGSFNADGLGNVGGVMDTNGPEYPSEVQNGFSGTYTVGSDGRGSMDISVDGSPVTFCFALDSFTLGAGNETAAHAAVIEDDTSKNTAAGEFFAQTVNPSLASVKGAWVVGLAGRLHSLVAGKPDLRHTVTSIIVLDGAGNVTKGEGDENNDVPGPGGTVLSEYEPQFKVTGTYTMTSPTGRGTLHVTGPGGNYGNFVFYPAGPNYFAALEVDDADTGPESGAPVLVGGGYKRTQATFSLATGLIGSSVRARYFLTNIGESSESSGVGLDVAQWDGAGNFTYSGDTNANGTASTASGSGKYTVDANGRFEVLVGGVCSPCGYLTRDNAGVGIYDSPDGAVEIMEYQDVPVGGPFLMSDVQGAYSVGTRWFIFPEQQTLSGEVISDGSGNFTGTLDSNQEGDTQVNQPVVETETTTSTSGVHGRFLLFNHDGSTNSALYYVNPNRALSIQLSGSNGQTQPLNEYVHQ